MRHLELLRLVVLDSGSREAWPALPHAAPAGSIWLSEVGGPLRVLADGKVEPVLAGAHPRAGIAGDPSARSRRVAA